MLRILRGEPPETSLTGEELEALATVLEDLLANRGRRDPSLNARIVAAVQKILRELEGM
jgi:hypothetical protein